MSQTSCPIEPVRMVRSAIDTVLPTRLGKWLVNAVKAAAVSTLAGAAAAVLAPLWERSHVQYSFPYDPTPTGAEEPLSSNEYQRTTVYFSSQGERCEAWLYLPSKPSPSTSPQDPASPSQDPARPSTSPQDPAPPTQTPATPPPATSQPSPHPPATTPGTPSATPSTAPDTTAADTPPPPSHPTTSPHTHSHHPDPTHPATVSHMPYCTGMLQREPSVPEPLPEVSGPPTKLPATPLPAVVLMAHGLGAQKDMGLHRYAHQFAEAGFAVLVFDYRGFGGSEGMERHIGTPGRYLQDWEAAWRFLVTKLSGQVDTSRVTLWGNSYSGGHVLVMAARHADRVASVISQEPFLSARAIALPNVRRRGLLKVTRAMLVALHDSLRGAAGLPPAYIKAVGQQHDLALLEVTDDEYQTFLVSPGTPPVRQGGWSNLMAARSGLAILRYNPIDWLPRVRCPVMFVAGSRDYLCPPDLIERAFRRAPGGSELVVKTANHFELFRGMYVEADVIPEMVRFAAQHCGPTQTAPPGQ